MGVEYVNYYAGTGSPAAPYGDLQISDDAVNGLIDIVNDPNTSWFWRFSYGNSSAWEKDWKASRLGGLAETYCDNVDLVAFCGHGLGNNFVFSTQKDDWYTDITDLDAGYKDAEWMLTFTCNFLKGTFEDFAYWDYKLNWE
ncbi:DUF6345 domain-containing protein [Caldicoprobacter guelmensis]|uniref:DUF6345 domain-containing protein n=1 Tax=Caldicoprobacter guelmensis TaxID=1170224 RepID=UPI0037436610